MITGRLELASIGELIEKVASWNPRRDGPDDELAYIDLSAVDNLTKVVTGIRTVRGRDAPSRARQLVQTGDILVSTVRPNLNGVARVPEALDGATASTGFCILRPKPSKLDANYLFHWVRSPQFVSDMVRKATGASYPAVSDKIIGQSDIPLPSLGEQKRISAILDQADELRRKRKRSLDRLNQLGQAIFVEMFGNGGVDELQELASVCDMITDGTHYTPTYAATGVVFLSAKNVTKRRIDWDNVKYIPESLHIELQRRVKPQINDVLLAKNGTTGVAALVDRDCVFDIYVSLALLRPSKKVLPKYLLEAINWDKTRRQFDSSLKGIGVSNLHLVDIRSAVIPMPSIDKQAVFVRRIEEIERLRNAAERAIARQEDLFSSLQHRAFRRDLTASTLNKVSA